VRRDAPGEHDLVEHARDFDAALAAGVRGPHEVDDAVGDRVAQPVGVAGQDELGHGRNV
jgi:hypothetical protein